MTAMARSRRQAEQDHIDAFLEKHGDTLPVDLETEAIVDRITGLSKRFISGMEDTLAGFDLNYGEWRVLTNLRWVGAPYRRTPGQLAKSAELSSGAMTNRLDRLEEAGLVQATEDRLDHERARVAAMPNAVHERDHSAERVAEHDRTLDPEHVAEVPHGVGAELEAPLRGVAPVRPAVSRKVEVNDLRDLGEPREVGLEVRVVETAGPAVQQDDGRPFAHRRALRCELDAVDVEPEARPVDVDVHQ
jgi:DNA-binding Lrp family transcriptional regulator